MNEDIIAKECISQWGVMSQINIAIEECAELITELAKIDRKVNGTTTDKVCSEIADVEIMMKQLRLIFSPETINDIKERKLHNLENRLKLKVNRNE
jgi:hypothetical protein